MPSTKPALLAVALAAALAACSNVRPEADPTASTSAELACTRCHGDASRPADTALEKAAPPRGIDGSDGAAHLSHLKGGAFRGPIACTECHVVPTSTTHSDGKVDVDFGTLAKSGGATPGFANGTCSGVYCHGATLSAGGTQTTPAWVGGYVTCTSCHGHPPPSHDPSSTDCSKCHPGTVKADGTLDLAGGLHINGSVDVSGSCTSCHGDSTRASNQAAPPVGTKGETATTTRAVGAHQKHLTGGSIRGAMACTDCHVVPSSTSHANGTVDLTWGALAKTGGATPSWNGTALTCANYCHGSTLAAGGTNQAPVWTGGPAQAACGTCHGVPPTGGHTTSTACGSCHPGYTSTSVNLTTHVNGTVDVSGALSCTSCHGDSTRASNPAAPPAGTHGETATTTRAVGAHQKHLTGGSIRGAMPCSECHVTPASTSHSNGTVDLTWGTLAKSGGATPSWNGTALTCANYCHGSTLAAGGTNQAPLWTGGSAQAACGTCHGAPPPAPHSTSTACGSCHAGYTQTTVNLTTHINGTVDVSALSCTSCHGDSTRASNQPAPPVGTHGETATTTRAVGAHQKHLTGGSIRGAMPCSECHVTPTSTSHSNGTVDLAWGTLAKSGGANPSWNGTALTCANYCHGATLAAGGTNQAPVWTGGSAQAACGTCHGAPPPAPHSTSTACGSCHAGYTQTTVNLTTHINGTLDVAALSCTSCHGDSTRASNQPAPPVGTKGETATTTRAVGAHQKHLTGGSMRGAMPCSECHVTPTSTSHSNGVVDLTWGTLAKTGTTPSWNGTALTCANYCHGATLTSGTNRAPVWTSGSSQATCGTCHGVPPSTGRHTANSSHRTCANCHSGYTNTTVNLTAHVDGAKQVGGTGTKITSWSTSTRTCSNSCHGSETW